MGDVANFGGRRGTNLPRMGNFNQSVILDAIRRSPEGLSRIELAAATGLTPGTITNISRRLLDLGYIEEAGRPEHRGPGKPRTLLRLRGESQYSLGVHLDPAVITLVALDLAGNVVADARRPTPEPAEPDAVVAAIAEGLEQLVRESALDRSRIAGVGIAAPGPIDTAPGHIVDPPNLPSWHRVPLRDAVEEALGMPTLLEKDVTAAAVAEMWNGPADTSGFVFVYLGTGVAASLVLDDQVTGGVSGNAGEIGHLVVDPDGPRCVCGQRGCVAVSATPQSVVREAVEAGVLPGDADWNSIEVVDALFTRVADAAAAGDGRADAILARFARRLGIAVAALVNFTDVERVIFGGPFWARVEEQVLEVVPQALEEMRAARSIHPVSVRGSELGEDVAAAGAACLVLNHLLAPRPEVLLLGS